MVTVETEEKLILAAVGVFAVYYFLKSDLNPFSNAAVKNDAFKSQTGLVNSALRQNETVNQQADRTFITVGENTYSIKNSDLPETGYIERRAGLVSALPDFLQFNWLKNWVYS